MGGIVFEKLNNALCVVFSYFGTRVRTPDEQPFIHFIMFPP